MAHHIIYYSQPNCPLQYATIEYPVYAYYRNIIMEFIPKADIKIRKRAGANAPKSPRSLLGSGVCSVS